MGFVVEQEFKAFPIAGKVQGTNNTTPVEETADPDWQSDQAPRFSPEKGLRSGKTFLTPRLQGIQLGHQDINLPPPAAARQTRKNGELGLPVVDPNDPSIKDLLASLHGQGEVLPFSYFHCQIWSI
ncbi:hypothetical protein ABZP36_020493 [Zizania latifolia]